MELNNDFEVGAPVDEAWAVLTDVERIAPCLPGAQLQEVEGDEYRGTVKVKVGPITAQYKGSASFVEKDDAGHRAVLKASGRDTRGAGNASAVITAHLEPLDGRTKVTVHTDLTVTGKVAQFGRGVMADVSAKLMGQFADNLESLIEGRGQPAGEGEASGEGAPASAAGGTAAGVGGADAPGTAAASGDGSGSSADTAASGVRRIDSPDAAPVDLFDAAGSPVLKRVLPVLGALVGLVVLRRLVRRRRS